MSAAGEEPFEPHRLGGGRIVCWARRADAGSLVAAGIDQPDRLLRERGLDQPGRGPVAVIRFAGGEAVLKRYRRGGLAGHLLPDRFLRLSPFRRELGTAAAARRRSIPVPEPLALIRAGRRAPFRVFGLTRRVAGARNLAAAIESAAPAERRGWIESIAATLRGAHDRGLIHADLNLGNFLIDGAPGGTRVHLIDLVGARLTDRLTARQRARSLRRLRRSWEKRCYRLGQEPGSEVARFLIRYCAGDARLRSALRSGRGWSRVAFAAHRLLWRREDRSRPA